MKDCCMGALELPMSPSGKVIRDGRYLSHPHVVIPWGLSEEDEDKGAASNYGEAGDRKIWWLQRLLHRVLIPQTDFHNWHTYVLVLIWDGQVQALEVTAKRASRGIQLRGAPTPVEVPQENFGSLFTSLRDLLVKQQEAQKLYQNLGPAYLHHMLTKKSVAQAPTEGGT